MNKQNRSSNTRSFSRHKFQKFYFKKSFRCKTFKINKQSSLYLNIQIYRPLIQFSRFEFLKFCEFWYLPVLPDLTNLNVQFYRNRLRLQSLPYLKFFFNIYLFQKIDSIQKIINLENEYFQLIIQKLLLTSLKTFQYSNEVHRVNPSLWRVNSGTQGSPLVHFVDPKHGNPLINPVNKIFKLKHSSFIAENNRKCYFFVSRNDAKNLRISRNANYSSRIRHRPRLDNHPKVMSCKSVMFQVYTNTAFTRLASRNDVILENIEKNIQIYCSNLWLISVFKQNQRFYYKLIKSCFQTTHSDFKAHVHRLTQCTNIRQRQLIIHRKSRIAIRCPRFAYNLQGIATITGQTYNIELFFWIYKYFGIQFKSAALPLVRETGVKIRLDLDKKKFNNKLLQKKYGSKMHFIKYNMLGLKTIRSLDLFYHVRSNFLYFPKILQYRILHNFYHFIQKKISFNEISCVFQRITVFLNSKYRSSKKK